MTPAASRVFMVSPLNFRYNPETGSTNAFQVAPSPSESAGLAVLANDQHQKLRALLESNGVEVALAESLPSSPDAPFCNNWFSTHPAEGGTAATLVLYPLLAENRRVERRKDLVDRLRPQYSRVVDLSVNEQKSRFLESTGSLVLDLRAKVAYAALSPRTDLSLAREWAAKLGPGTFAPIVPTIAPIVGTKTVFVSATLARNRDAKAPTGVLAVLNAVFSGLASSAPGEAASGLAGPGVGRASKTPACNIRVLSSARRARPFVAGGRSDESARSATPGWTFQFPAPCKGARDARPRGYHGDTHAYRGCRGAPHPGYERPALRAENQSSGSRGRLLRINSPP